MSEDTSSLTIALDTPVNAQVTVLQPVVTEVPVTEIKITAIRANYLPSEDGTDRRQLFVRVNNKSENILVAEGAECQAFEDAITPLLTPLLKSKLTPELVQRIVSA